MHRDVGTCVTRGFQQIMRSSNIQTSDLPQMPDDSALIVRRRVEPCADRRGSEVHLQKQSGVVVTSSSSRTAKASNSCPRLMGTAS